MQQVAASHDACKILYREALDVRASLRQQGYFPIPVEHRGKMPRIAGWQKLVYDPKRPQPMLLGRFIPDKGIDERTPHLSTGIRCAGVCAFDIDCPEPSMAEDVHGIIVDVLGWSPATRLRDGTAKLAVFYRWAPATEELARSFRLSHASKLEIAGSGGRHMVVHGEHPESRDAMPVRYRFEEDPLWEIAWLDLPPVSVDQIDEIVRRVVHTYPPSEGAAASIRGDAMPPIHAVNGILAAHDFHNATNALIGHLAKDGVHASLIEEYIGWVYEAVPESKRDARYWERRDDIARCVRDITRAETRKATSLYRVVRRMNETNALSRSKVKARNKQRDADTPRRWRSPK